VGNSDILKKKRERERERERGRERERKKGEIGKEVEG
jgi:hypothetical protein